MSGKGSLLPYLGKGLISRLKEHPWCSSLIYQLDLLLWVIERRVILRRKARKDITKVCSSS